MFPGGKDEFDEALDSMQFVTRISPTTEMLFLLGQLAEKMGKFDLAEEALSAAYRDKGAVTRLRRGVAQLLFEVLLEDGKRDGAMDSREKKDGSSLTRITALIRAGLAEMSQLVGMLVAPVGTDCLLDRGFSLTERGAVSLPRMVLLDRIQHSENVEVRNRAQEFLDHRLPDHPIASEAEALNGLGHTFQHTHEEPEKPYICIRAPFRSIRLSHGPTTISG